LTRAVSTPYYAVLLLVLPILSFAFLIAIFRAGVPRDLPVAVVDEDRSALSRQLARMIDATPSMRVAWQAANAGEARALVLENKAYAAIGLRSRCSCGGTDTGTIAQRQKRFSRSLTPLLRSGFQGV
jgi:hypothetical protein